MSFPQMQCKDNKKAYIFVNFARVRRVDMENEILDLYTLQMGLRIGIEELFPDKVRVKAEISSISVIPFTERRKRHPEGSG